MLSVFPQEDIYRVSVGHFRGIYKVNCFAFPYNTFELLCRNVEFP
uniref:Uncharacterized protein n=1 Tax=Anguilla anguilla TaxID=7936 RepID=A0A0E9TMX9_ANGAN